MSRAKNMRVINEVKGALDAALSDGAISQDAYDRINIPGLKPKKQAYDWSFEDVAPPPPEPELIPEPEVEPEAEPEPEAVPITEDYDTVVVDDLAPEAKEEVGCGAAPEEIAETGMAASSPSQVEQSQYERSPVEAASDMTKVEMGEVRDREKEKGFAFTTCFRCGRVEVTRYGEGSLPKEVKGKCTVDNGIVMIVCGMCREKGSSSKKNNTESFQVEFAELRLSAELFEGSMVQKVASAILCQEVPFITEEGGVAYREINAMIAGLGREDKMMSVDVEKYKSGGRTGLVFGFLAGGLIRSVERQKKEKCEREDVEEWAFDGKKKKSLFSVRM
jgi:hypothetical protein